MALLRLASRWPASSKFVVGAPPSLHGKALEPLRSGFVPVTTSSAAAKSASAAATTEALRGSAAVGQAGPGQRRDVLDATFDDAHAAYKSKTTWEILRAYIVYTLCSSNYLVENNMKVSNQLTALPFLSLPRGSYRVMIQELAQKLNISDLS